MEKIVGVKIDTAHEFFNTVESLDWERIPDKSCRLVLRNRRALELALYLIASGQVKVDDATMTLSNASGSINLVHPHS